MPIMAEISRASQLLSHQRWRCEREFPNRWGQRTQIDVTVNLGDALQQLAERRLQRIAAQSVVAEQQKDGETVLLPSNNIIESE